MSFSTKTIEARNKLINKKRTGINGTSEWVKQALKDQALKKSSNKPQKQSLEPSKDIIEVIAKKATSDTKWGRCEASRKYYFDGYESLPLRERKVLDFVVEQVFKMEGKRVDEFYIVDIPSMKFRIEGIDQREIRVYTGRLVKRGCLACELVQSGRYSIKRYAIHFKLLDSSPASVVRNLYSKPKKKGI